VVCVCTHGGRRSQGAAAWLVGEWEGARGRPD
jgi:hypothetical protein